MARKTIPIAPYLDKLEQALAIGATYELAAQYAGVSPSTFARWRHAAQSAKPGTDLALLRDRLQQAEARAAIGWLAKIEVAASNGDWRAAAWKLSVRWPEAYGHRARADLTLQIQRVAEEVGAELGLDPAEILKEARSYLKEHR